MKENSNMRKEVLLTGSSGVIGRVLVSALLKEDYDLIAVVNTDASIETLENLFPDAVLANKLVVLKSDLANAASRKRLISDLLKRDRPIYAVINNARSINNLKQGDNGYIEEDVFIAEFNLGVYAPYDLVWRLANMASVNLKRVINISSIYGVVAMNTRLYEDNNKSPLHYGVVKSALIHLTKEIAVRLAAKKITVNAISYGGLEGRADSEFMQRYAQLCPQSTMLTSDDLAGSVKFLLSEETKSITGHNLLVDGGWTLW